MNTGEKIQFYRKSKKVSPKQLSEFFGVSKISIRKYETRYRFYKLGQLKNITSVLEIDGNELLEIQLDTVKFRNCWRFLYVKEKAGYGFYTRWQHRPQFNLHPL